MIKNLSFRIVIPVFNAKKYIEKCIDSIQKQSFKKFKALIIDDCSIDNTFDIFIETMQDISSKYYRFINLKKNFGLTYGKNLLINTSKAKYLASMDSDDICLPNRFKIQIDFLKENPHIDVLGGLAVNFYKNKQIKSIISNIKNKRAKV